jgi:hypothetical protein
MSSFLLRLCSRRWLISQLFYYLLALGPLLMVKVALLPEYQPPS